MKMRIFNCLLALAASAAAIAMPLGPEEALQRIDAEGARKMKGATPEYVETIKCKDGTPAMYVFTYSGPRGFMLVAADDAVTPLLGYSEENSFSLTDMPENFRSWIEYYADDIRAAKTAVTAGAMPNITVKTRAGEMAAIEPMIKTTWDQTAPFNNQCPLVGSYRCVTGCVATAMAQVMKYWEYPAQGKGSVEYTVNGIDNSLTMDFGATTFDWANMLDVYGRLYSATEGRAVSTLMKACGYSVKMNYGVRESGAYSSDITTALINYFGYDRGVNQRKRSGYGTQEEWNQMIYNEMKTSGPVIYSGQSSSGAHCFVCDGYDGNGYFHINWGWGGMSNGYFLLNELTPKEVGTGGHYGGYNIYQDAIVGIMPPVGRLSVESIEIENAADDSGNVKGWGYTYRINDFSNMHLSVNLRITGGHISSPLYYTIYETNPDTKQNVAMVLDSTFDQSLNAGEGNVKCSTRVRFDNYDPTKLYTMNVAYDLKGTRTAIGSIRLAASSGVDEVTADAGLGLTLEGRMLKASQAASVRVYDMSGAVVAGSGAGSSELNLDKLQPGVYVAVATGEGGETRTLKLLLR